MKVRIREGNDFDVVWAIKRAGQPEDLSSATSMKLTLVVYGLVIEHELFTVTGNVLSINVPKEIIPSTGDYRLVLEYTLPDAGQHDGDLKCKTDVVPFRIVPFTADADDIYTVNVISDIAFGFKGDKGDNGDDAYQIWLDLGNEGTYEDFIAYMRQPAVDAGASISELEGEIQVSEGLRVQAETARVNAEGDATKGRVKAENERVTAEGERAAAETARVNAEGDATKGRVKAENERVQAEGERAQAFEQMIGEADDKIEEMDTTLSTYDGRVTQVESDIDQLAGDVSGIFWEDIEFTDGRVLYSASGNVVENASYSASDYIAVYTGAIILYTGNTASSVYAKYAFYNKNKEFISAYNTIGAVSDYEVIIPEGIYYIRLSGHIVHAAVGHVSSKILKNTKFIESDYNEKIADVYAEVDEIKEVLSFNVEYLEDSGYLAGNGGIEPYSGTYEYKVSDFIPVVPGYIVRYSGVTGASTYGLWWYNQHKMPITYAIGTNQNLKDAEFIAPMEASYCRVSGRGNVDGLPASSIRCAIHAITNIYENIQSSPSAWNGKTMAVIGDSVSAPYYAPAEVVIATEDIGRPFNCYITGYDVADYAAVGTPAKNKSIHSCVIPSAMVGKVMECVVKSENIGDIIGGVTITPEMVGTAQSFTIIEADATKTLYGVKITQSMEGIEFSFTASTDDVGLVLGESRGYAPNNTSTTVWFNIIASALQMEVIGASNWSGSTYSRVTSTGANVCSYAWHPQTIRKIAERDIITGERVAPDCVLLFRGINDWSKTSFAHITDWNTLTEGYPVNDFIDGSTSQYDFKKAITKTIEMIRNEYPLTRIFICTLYHNKYRGTVIEGDPENEGMQPFPPTNYTYTIMEYNKAIREIADAYGLGLIELDKCGITYENLLTYTPDGVHANAAGHALIATRAIKDMSE